MGYCTGIPKKHLDLQQNPHPLFEQYLGFWTWETAVVKGVLVRGKLAHDARPLTLNIRDPAMYEPTFLRVF